MRVFKTTMILGVVGLLMSGRALAQTPPAQTPPAQQTPPQQTPPAKPPAAQQPAPTPQPPKPFPEGAKIAYVNIQSIASGSAEGKAASAKLDELRKKKTGELAEKNKQADALKTKLSQSGQVLNDQARGQLEKDIEKLNRDIQFFQQDANQELQEMQNQLQADFQEKLNPILEQVATEKGLHMLLDIQGSGAVWANTGLDLTQEVIKRFDAAAKTGVKK